MQKQFVITVNTANTSAVEVFDSTSSPVTPSGAQFVAEEDNVREALNAVEDRINSALLAAVRG